MNRKLILTSIFAALPAVLCAQEPKLVNCRTLESVDNFVGADEVLDNNMVCQKLKAGAVQPAKPLPSKVLLGVVISDSESANVTEAAKAAEKRAAAAKETVAAARQAAITPKGSTESTTATPATNAEPATAVSTPAAPTDSGATFAVAPPEEEKPEIVVRAKSPTNGDVAAPEPPPANAAAESATPVQGATPPEPTEIAKPATTEDSAAPTPASAEAANPPADAGAPAESNTLPSTAADTTPPDDPNAERERVVRTGAFDKPREEGPDPSTLAHKTTFQPGDEDGFQEGQRPGCTKNITMGGLKDEKLVLGTPEWAEKWIEKNQKRMPQVCFSDTPMPGARNYLIVFYTQPPAGATANGAGPTNAAPATPQQTPAYGEGTFTTSYGSTWHYSVDRTVGVTVLTSNEADEPQSQPGQALYATAYSEEGVPVAQHWPEPPKHAVKLNTGSKKKDRAAREALERVSEELLSQMTEDILKL
ncbi:MAG: hypothetical protein WBL63_17625 [Candidatus Acidiferrum sp.]